MNAHKASSHAVIAGEELTSTDSKYYPIRSLSLFYVVKSILLSFSNIVVTVVVNSPMNKLIAFCTHFLSLMRILTGVSNFTLYSASVAAANFFQ
jgi:hypothetical protein